MKKLIIFLFISIISFSTFAQNSPPDKSGCLREIAKHVDGISLDLRYCYLQNEDMPTVAAFLEAHPDIISLNLSENYLDAEGLQTVLAKNKMIRDIHLDSDFKLGDQAGMVLAKSTMLRSITMDNTYIGSKGAQALATLPNLFLLSIANNHLRDEGAAALAKNTSLQFLFMANNNIGPEGATALAQLPHLLILNISANYIGDKGAIALAQGKYLDPVNYFDMSINHIGDKGAMAWSNGINIQNIFFDHNEIGNEGAIALANNTDAEGNGLANLDLDYNHIGPIGINALTTSNKILHVSAQGNDGEAPSAKNKITHLSSNPLEFYCKHYDKDLCVKMRR